MSTDVEKRSDCEHEPDFETVQPVREMPGVVDISCRKCGLSGSSTIDPADIQWD